MINLRLLSLCVCNCYLQQNDHLALIQHEVLAQHLKVM